MVLQRLPNTPAPRPVRRRPALPGPPAAGPRGHVRTTRRPRHRCPRRPRQGPGWSAAETRPARGPAAAPCGCCAVAGWPRVARCLIQPRQRIARHRVVRHRVEMSARGEEGVGHHLDRVLFGQPPPCIGQHLLLIPAIEPNEAVFPVQLVFPVVPAFPIGRVGLTHSLPRQWKGAYADHGLGLAGGVTPLCP